MAVAATTELEAINIMLAAIAEAPINSLTGTLPVDAVTARSTLAEFNKEVQSEGWSFNTDYQQSLVRDSTTNHISVGDNVSRIVVDHFDYPDIDVVQRGKKLYDRKNNTYEFEQNIKADITYILDWEDLPEHARNYIMVKTGRELQENMIGSKDLT